MHPSVTINNVTYRGDVNGYDIFKAVCAGFKDSPDICQGDKIFDALSVLEDTSTSSRTSHRVKTIHIVIAIGVVMVINLGALYLYRRYNKKKMNQELQMQVNSAVSQYFKLSAHDNNQSF